MPSGLFKKPYVHLSLSLMKYNPMVVSGWMDKATSLNPRPPGNHKLDYCCPPADAVRVVASLELGRGTPGAVDQVSPQWLLLPYQAWQSAQVYHYAGRSSGNRLPRQLPTPVDKTYEDYAGNYRPPLARCGCDKGCRDQNAYPPQPPQHSHHTKPHTWAETYLVSHNSDNTPHILSDFQPDHEEEAVFDRTSIHRTPTSWANLNDFFAASHWSIASADFN